MITLDIACRRWMHTQTCALVGWFVSLTLKFTHTPNLEPRSCIPCHRRTVPPSFSRHACRLRRTKPVRMHDGHARGSELFVILRIARHLHGPCVGAAHEPVSEEASMTLNHKSKKNIKKTKRRRTKRHHHRSHKRPVQATCSVTESASCCEL